MNHTCPALYLRPRTKFNGENWYTNQPVGVNKLQSVVKTVCKNAGLEVQQLLVCIIMIVPNR